MRQIIHTPVVAAKTHEGARRRRRCLASIRQRWRRLLFGWQCQRHGRRRKPLGPYTAATTCTGAHTQPASSPLDHGQTRKFKWQIPKPSRPKILWKTSSTSPTSTAPNKYRWERCDGQQNWFWWALDAIPTTGADGTTRGAGLVVPHTGELPPPSLDAPLRCRCCILTTPRLGNSSFDD